MSGADIRRLTGTVVVVTGGANGIGRTYCRALSAQGAHVVVADIDDDGAASLAEELGQDGGRALAVPTDVTSPESVATLVDRTTREFGSLSVLVNNAGTYPHRPFEAIDLAEWRRVLAVNLDSVFVCSQAVIGPMREQAHGKIVNIATNLVWTGLAGMAHYIAAKSGVVGLTRALARELGEYEITVNAIAPGAVPPASRISAEGVQRLGEIVRYQCVKRLERPADLVGMLLFLCSHDSDFASGQVFTIDGGLTTH